MDLITQLNNFMLKTEINYAICGGHAIDLFVGRKTRPHKDLDVAAYWEDRDKLIQYMLDDGWDVYEPCGKPHLHKINNVNNQMRIQDNIWCTKLSNKTYKFTEQEKDMYAVKYDECEQTKLDYIEFLFKTIKDGDFLYKRNHDIKLRLEKAILTANDIPILAPEMVLLYKSTAANETEYQMDFDNTLSELSKEQKAWLKNSLSIMFPDGHKWLDAIK